MHKQSPFSGLVFGPLFSALFSFCDDWNLAPMQAFAIWRWHNFTESEGVGDKTVVRISTDESCCKRPPLLKRGLVA